MREDPRILEADQVEAEAFADLFAAASPALAQQLGLQVRREQGATLLLAKAMPTAMFNRVIGAGLGAPLDGAQVQAWQEAYRAQGGKPWWLHWSPRATPVDGAALLQPLGFSMPARRSWAKVWRDAAPAPQIASDLVVEPLRDERRAATLAAIVQSFEMPPFMPAWLGALHGRPRWQLFSVRDGDQVVGGGALFIDGARAWLGMGGVVATHRRRGGQGALMARRIAAAIDAGCSDLYTETGEPKGDEPNPSLGNMLRCGFVKVASRLNFQAP